MAGTLAPWCVNEKWEYGILPDGRQYAKVTGRTPTPSNLKSSPLWWTRNDYEQQVADWYEPTWPQWRRQLYWNYFRNPLQNMRLFVLGWADRNYTVTVLEGNPNPMCVQRNDVIGPDGKPEQGYQKALLTADNGETRKWTSYCSGKVVWYNGTQPSGVYGAKLNFP